MDDQRLMLKLKIVKSTNIKVHLIANDIFKISLINVNPVAGQLCSCSGKPK